MNDVYSSKALKPNKCRIGYIEISGVCVPISRASATAISPPTPPTPPTPPPTPPTPPIPPTPPPSPDPPSFQPRSSDLGLQVGEGLAVAGGIGAASYGAYRNRATIQRNVRRMTQPKVKTDEEMGLLEEGDIEMSEARTMELQSRTRGRSSLVRRRFSSNVPDEETGLIEDFEAQETDLAREIRAEAQQSAEAQMEDIDLEIGGGAEEFKQGEITEDMGFEGGDFDISERQYFEEVEDIELTPIEEPSISPLIDDIVSAQTEEIADVAVSDAFLDTIVAGAGEEAVIGADIATTAALTATETALMVAPELAAALVVGGALYGIEKGVEEIFDVGSAQDKKYHDKRNNELGTHEMDKREIDYKLKELDKAKKYYTDQVEHHNFGDNPASKAQHEKDKAMLASINQSIDAIHNQQRNGVPVYSVVSQTGFNRDDLSSDKKKEYDRLVKRVADEQEQVDYHGADKTRLNNRKRKLDTFISENSNSSVPIAYVNKASDEELETITNDYIQNGGDIFTDIDPIMIDALGIGEAIGTDEVQNQRIQVEETQKNVQTTDDVAASQGLKTGGGSVA